MITNVPANKSKEIQWLQKASNYRNSNAHYRLAVAYRDGDGVGKDKNAALKYFGKAKAAKHTSAIYDSYVLKNPETSQRTYSKILVQEESDMPESEEE